MNASEPGARCLRMALIAQVLASFILSTLSLSTLAESGTPDFNQKLDLQFRLDDRSSRELRYQYRARYYPSVRFNPHWSAHAFAVTGANFGASHNSVDDGRADYFYVRRFFARHEGTYGKTEFGVIPTYKGRVSSSGLSKDGWIQGLRHVRNLRSGARLEAVVGQLNTVDPSQALGLPSDVDYVEIEFSADLTELTSYEFSLERMTGGNFVRSELRHLFGSRYTGFAEVVYRLDDSRTRLILGAETKITLFGNSTKLQAQYGYVSNGFGLRAELTEDFLGTGHAVRMQMTSSFGESSWDWFARFDGTEDRSRFLAGIKWSL